MLPPDPDELNDARARWAGQAVDRYQELTGADDEDVLADLLCDLMHLCDRAAGLIGTFDTELFRARQHYEAETDSER